jgi:hypothetical protein
MRERLHLRTICSPVVLWMAVAACGAEKPAEAPSTAPAGSAHPPAAASCPTAPVPTTSLPDVTMAQREVATWLSKLADADADAVLVDPSQIEGLNQRFSEVAGAWRDPTSHDTGDPDRVERDIEERLAYLRARADAGEIVQHVPGSLAEAEAIAKHSTAVDQFRIAVQESQLFCVPLSSGLFKPPVDEDFDRNHCASIHPGEMVRVLRRGAGGQWLYVHAGYVVGWLHAPVLTPRLSRDDLDRWQTRARVVPTRDDAATTDGFRMRVGTSFPLIERDPEGFRVLVPATDGLREAVVPPDAAVHEGHPPLTRRTLWELLFSQLDAPYGWGGRGGERDCSRYLRDAFATFGIQLARHSAVQAQLGTHNIDVSDMPEADKLSTIEHWAAQGTVLLYMPGHIMLYLGSDGAHHYGISSMSEFVEPCPGGPDTVHRVDRVAVTTLDLGRKTERNAFIERITRVVVFAPNADPDVSHIEPEPEPKPE